MDNIHTYTVRAIYLSEAGLEQTLGTVRYGATEENFMKKAEEEIKLFQNDHHQETLKKNDGQILRYEIMEVVGSINPLQK